jgi:AcrR family transcriptional regulator
MKKAGTAAGVTFGRPRRFDIDAALNRAVEVFWRKGYEGASVSDLTEAMGINPPSLYAAFGNKEALFRKALDRYQASHAAFWKEALDAPTAFEAVKRLLDGTAERLTEKMSCQRAEHYATRHYANFSTGTVRQSLAKSCL